MAGFEKVVADKLKAIADAADARCREIKNGLPAPSKEYGAPVMAEGKIMGALDDVFSAADWNALYADARASILTDLIEKYATKAKATASA